MSLFTSVFALLVLSLALLTPGCSDSAVMGIAEGGTPADNALPALPVAIIPAALGAMEKHYFATATLEANKEAELLARVSGVVLDLSTEEGDYVKPGEVLLRIEEDAYFQRLKQAEAEASKQKARFTRQENMFKKDLISAEEFDAARTDLQAAEAARKLAELELSHARVMSPFAGHIVTRSVDPGQMVNTNTSLFTVADMSRLLARVHVPAREFRNIKPGQPVTLTLDSNHEQLSGEIILVSPVIDPTSGTVKVTVAIHEYPANTRPGDFAEVSIVTDRHTDTILVPSTAVFTDRGEQVVYIVKGDMAARCPVETGFQDDERIEILRGIHAGDQVVIQGQRSLKHEQPVKVLPGIDFGNGSEAVEPTAPDEGGESREAAPEKQGDE
ncbi:MAG: efflux RND transporter periplasmic adaptor subunit [Planctomycetota bacterium]